MPFLIRSEEQRQQQNRKRTVLTVGLTAVAVVTLLTLWCADAHADERVSVSKPLAIYAAAAGADYLSTRYALSVGARESNPLMRTHGSLVGWKAAQVGLLMGADIALQKRGHKGKACALRITAAVVGASLAGWNMRTAARQRSVR